MCHRLLQDARFHQFLLHADQDLAETTREKGCPICCGKLHRADYQRKPRGDPEDRHDRRISFCCAQEGCRRRATPPSLRFLGRKVYLGAVVVLATVMQHGETPYRLLRLQEVLRVSRRTLKRWRIWWQTTFAQSPFWKAARGLLANPIREDDLPMGLLARMGFGDDPLGGMVRLLRLLTPITVRPYLCNQAI